MGTDMLEQTNVSPQISPRCPDTWRYDLSLYRRPAILFLLWKIFLGITAGIWLFMVLISCGDSGFFWQGFWDVSCVFAILAGFMLLLCAAGYYIYALLMGGFYCMEFKLDEKGITHCQIPSQAAKARRLGIITALLGVMARRPGTAGIGIMSAARTSMRSNFASVTAIKACPHEDLIILRSGLSSNRIYVNDQDYDAVLSFIRAHVKPKGKTAQKDGASAPMRRTTRRRRLGTDKAKP